MPAEFPSFKTRTTALGKQWGTDVGGPLKRESQGPAFLQVPSKAETSDGFVWCESREALCPREQDPREESTVPWDPGEIPWVLV